MPKLLYTWYFEKFTASVTSSGHSALRHEVSRMCSILTKNRYKNYTLFYKIINNLAVVPHSCLEKADVRTRKKHSQKFRNSVTTLTHNGQSFIPITVLARGMALLKTLQRPTL